MFAIKAYDNPQALGTKEFYDDMNNEDKDNDTKNLLPKGKVFAEDDSVAQIDNSALDI